MRAFCLAIDLGGVGKAARLLQISQPALSKRLRMLEAVAGAQLLERSSWGVRPTSAGERLYAAARQMLTEAEIVEGLLFGLTQEDEPVRLATSHTVAEFLLAKPLAKLQQHRRHHLSVELTVVNSTAASALVHEGRVEVAIAAREPDGQPSSVTELPFGEDEIVVAVPEGHPWARIERVPLQEFVKARMITRDPHANSRRIVDAALHGIGLSLAPPLAEIGSSGAAKATALSERVPLLISHLAVGPGDGLLSRRVQGLRFRRLFVVLHAGEENLRPPARTFVADLLASSALDASSGSPHSCF